jgi:hypothetical protein
MITPVAQTDPGPFSSVVDYDELRQQEEARKKQLQDSQQRIMRTNAIGDAFRLLSDAVTANKNATISPRPVNPEITAAANKYEQIGAQSDAKMNQLQNSEINLKLKDKQDQLADEAAVRQHQWQSELLGQQQQAREVQSDKALQNREKIANINAKSREIVATRQADARLKQTQITTEARKNKVPGGTTDKSSIEIKDPNTKTVVKVPSYIIDKMIMRLQGDKKRYDPQLDAVVKAVMNNKRPDPVSLRNVLNRHWADLRDLVPELSSTPGSSTSQTGALNIKPEEKGNIQKVIALPNYTKEQKRSAIYGYLIKQGYNDAQAKDFAEYVYSNL